MRRTKGATISTPAGALKAGGPPTCRFDHHGDILDRQLSERYCDVASALHRATVFQPSARRTCGAARNVTNHCARIT